MKINQYYDREEKVHILEITITSQEDFEDLKRIIKMYVYGLASEEESEIDLIVTKNRFTLKVEGYTNPIENTDPLVTQTYLFAKVIHDIGEDQTIVLEFTYDKTAMSLKKIAKTIYEQFDIAMKHYKTIAVSSKSKIEEML